MRLPANRWNIRRIKPSHNALYLDSRQRMWVATRTGVKVYDRLSTADADDAYTYHVLYKIVTFILFDRYKSNRIHDFTHLNI
jgi:ligand-binding sensor domain-containing protein